MYSNDLLAILITDFPESRKEEESFLDITGQSYKEVIISRIYAYFLNSKNRQIALLFLNALTELIRERSGKELKFTSFICHTEHATKLQNRIDLMIISEVEKKCIIIENKIFHALNNDLLDYWNVNNYSDCDKVGVLLTLKQQAPGTHVNGKFINITHKEWMLKIKQRGLPFNLSAREFNYLSDFIKHMEKISETSEMNEEARFFFEHPGKILKAIDIYYEALEYVIAQLRVVAEKTGWELIGASEEYRHIRDVKNNRQVYYAFEIYKLFDPVPEINIILEISKDAIQKEESFRTILAGNSFYNNLPVEGRRSPGWLHFANKWYRLDKAQISNLAEFVLQAINADFKPVMDLIIQEMDLSSEKGEVN